MNPQGSRQSSFKASLVSVWGIFQNSYHNPSHDSGLLESEWSGTDPGPGTLVVFLERGGPDAGDPGADGSEGTGGSEGTDWPPFVPLFTSLSWVFHHPNFDPSLPKNEWSDADPGSGTSVGPPSVPPFSSLSPSPP